LTHGHAHWLAAGRVGAHRFFCAAGFGGAMQLQTVREHVRQGQWRSALHAARTAFAGLANEPIEIGAFGRTVGCVLAGVGPLDSAFGLRKQKPRRALEIATWTTPSLWGAATIAPSVLFGGWRTRTGVTASEIDTVKMRTSAPQISALFDGEFVQLPQSVRILYEPKGGLVWGRAFPAGADAT
jgi:hypothetical protein